MACMDTNSSMNFSSGVYRRVYDRNVDVYELVELKDDGNIYIQKFYEHGKLRFSNTGKWTYINSNQDHSPKWPNGRSIILFSEWLSAEELLRHERLGVSSDPTTIKKEQVAAIVRDYRRFAFDEDGGSDYKRDGEV